MYVKAIETLYAGVKFRSRLEARWARFFDSAGIRWEYEPEAFAVGDWRSGEGEADSYLPDFGLPDLGAYVECKGSLEQVSNDYLAMIARAIDWGGALPGISDSANTSRGLLWLFSVPDASRAHPVHPILQHHKGGWVNAAVFTSNGRIEVADSGSHYFDGMCNDGSSLRQLLQPHERGMYLPEVRTPPLVRAAYSQARSERFQQGGWAQ